MVAKAYRRSVSTERAASNSHSATSLLLKQGVSFIFESSWQHGVTTGSIWVSYSVIFNGD